ncbi:hypothetical protein BC941DRAFT_517327 [Chlamydoabsidia padenii]|nr:hypothetical protein BC941DRAFT_517327 [Chlamydoabsidia padenii]
MEIKDKVALIYGGTSGIGKELTKTLVSLGAYVVFSGKNKEKGEALASILSEEQAVFFQCDVTNWDAQQEMYNVAKRQFKDRSVDIVVMVAGILDSSDLLNDNDQEEQEGTYRTLQVNLTAAVKANRLAIQHFLREKKPGCIINTSSIYGFCGAPLAPMYSASKHAIIGLTKSYGSLLKPTNIRVNAVAPSFIETPMVNVHAQPTAAAVGYVSMSSCIDAYLQIIRDTSLNGNVLIITSDSVGSEVENRFLDPLESKLVELSEARQNSYRHQLLNYFQVK